MRHEIGRSLPLLVLCPILLTVDLGRPQDFWHMLVNSASGSQKCLVWRGSFLRR